MGKKGDKNATAFHGMTADGTNVVGVGKIRVVLVPDEGGWFAQGLEIDYAAQGETIEEVQDNFANGLAATVHQHLKAFGSIDKVLCVAPQSVWKEMLYDPTAKKYRFSQISAHEFEHEESAELGYEGISFLIPQLSDAPLTVAV